MEHTDEKEYSNMFFLFLRNILDVKDEKKYF